MKIPSLRFWPERKKKKEHRKRRQRAKRILFLLSLILVYIGLTLFPLRKFLTHDYLFGQTLIVFTNEFEARPCGGFVTAYGVVRPLPPSVELKNSYAMAGYEFGAVPTPLDKVSDTLRFWDLGVSPNLAQCTERFREAYHVATGQEIRNVVLVDFATIESVFRLFRHITLGELELTPESLFSTLTRTVADVDRHNEEALAERKSPLADLGKKMIRKALINPSLPPRITHVLGQEIDRGGIYATGVSAEYGPEANDFAVVEWNLGAAKSSRFLKKILKINARETRPNHWAWRVELTMDHLGGQDEPLSQPWGGEIEMHWPKFLGGGVEHFEATIDPMQIFRKRWYFESDGEIREIRIFRPRGMKLFGDISVSAYPQQQLTEASFPVVDHAGNFFGVLTEPKTVLRWEQTADDVRPFLTLHEPVNPEQVPAEIRTKHPEANFFVELHTSEECGLAENFAAVLEDTDHTVGRITENPRLVSADFVPNTHTLILGFQQEEIQHEERFTLSLQGIEDLWGNAINPESRWTIIDRVN